MDGFAVMQLIVVSIVCISVGFWSFNNLKETLKKPLSKKERRAKNKRERAKKKYG